MMKQTGKILLAVCAVCALLSANALAFTVVEGGDLTEINAPHEWAKAEIEQAREAGLLTEHTDDCFKEDITRFQFAELDCRSGREGHRQNHRARSRHPPLPTAARPPF